MPCDSAHPHAWDHQSPHMIMSTGSHKCDLSTGWSAPLVGRRSPATAAAFLDFSANGQAVSSAGAKRPTRHAGASFLGAPNREDEWPSKSVLYQYLYNWGSSCPEWMPGAYSSEAGTGFCGDLNARPLPSLKPGELGPPIQPPAGPGETQPIPLPERRPRPKYDRVRFEDEDDMKPATAEVDLVKKAMEQDHKAMAETQAKSRTKDPPPPKTPGTSTLREDDPQRTA